MTFITGQSQDEPEKELTESLGEGETTFVAGEKKKSMQSSTLGLLGLLAICAGGTYFMYLRGGPAKADAAEVATADSISTFLADGEKHVSLMKQMLKDTDKVVQRFRQSTAKNQVPLSALSTNPFQMENEKPAVAQDDSASNRRRKDEERSAALQAVRDLKLQSILFGARRAALMNGQLIQEGQEVEGFVLEKINPDSVIVRRTAYRFELKMQK